MENTSPDDGSQNQFDEENSKSINTDSALNITIDINKEVLTQAIDKEIQITNKNLNIVSGIKLNSKELFDKNRPKKQRYKDKLTLLNEIIHASKDKNDISVEVTDKLNTIEISNENQSITIMKVKNKEGGSNTAVVQGLTVQVNNNLCNNGKKKKPSEATKNTPITKNKVMNPRTRAIEGMNKPVEIDRAVKMMQRMGWTGGSLGVRGDGITEPIKPAMDQVARAGFGSVQPENVPQPNTTNKNNNRRTDTSTGDVTQPVSSSVNLNHMPEKVANLLTRKDLTKINRLFEHQHKVRSREPPQYRLDFLTKLLEFIVSDNTVTNIKYYPELTKRERRFATAAIKVLNGRSKLSLLGEEMVKILEILEALNGIPDLTLTCGFKTKFDMELSKMFNAIDNVNNSIKISDIDVRPEEMLPNLKDILNKAPNLKSRKTFDVLKFRVEFYLKLIYFIKMADMVLELVYDKPIIEKQLKYLGVMVEALNKRVRHGGNKCEVALFVEVLKNIGFWKVKIEFRKGFTAIKITKEQMNTPPPIKKHILFIPSTKKEIKPTIDKELHKDDVPFTTDKHFDDDDLMIVEPYIETIIINDDTDGENEPNIMNNKHMDENVFNITIKQEKDIGLKDVSNKVVIPKSKDGVIGNDDTQLYTSTTDTNIVVDASKTELIGNSNIAQNNIDSCIKENNATNIEGNLINNISEEILTINNTEETINNYNTSQVINNIECHENLDKDRKKDKNTVLNTIIKENETPELLKNTDLEAEITENTLKDDFSKTGLKNNSENHDLTNINLEHIKNFAEGREINTGKSDSKDNLELEIDNTLLSDEKIEKCETDLNMITKTEPTEDCLHDYIVCLVPNNYPNDFIDDKKVIEIQLTISSNILITKDLPLLKCHGVQNGALIYSCHTKNSFDFIKKIISVVSDIEINSIKVDTMSLKFKTFFDFNIEYLFNMLELYNPELSTKDWTVVNTDINSESVTLITKMDIVSINYILQSHLTIYAGIDKIEFSIYLN